MAGLALAALPGAARTEPRDPSGVRRLLTSPRLLDDPGGTRSLVERYGLTLQLFYNQYLAWKPEGGAEPGSAFGHSASYDLFGLADLEELAGWPGLDLLLHVKGQYDENVNEAVGALSDPVDDADFDQAIYVDELWLEQGLLDDRVRLRAGFLEQQTVFDRNAYANSEDKQFSSTYLDNNGLVPLPNGLGAVLLVRPADWLEIAAGAADADNVPRRSGFDTAFDGLKSLTATFELTARARLPGASRLPGAFRAGVFLDGRRKPVFGRDSATGLPRTRRGHFGAYLSLDQLAFRERPQSPEGLGLFARAGYADEDTSRVAWFWSAGLQYEGLLPGRSADVLGLGTYQTLPSERYREAVDPDFGRELGVELYYRIALLPWLAVTPDLQVILDPGASGSDDATVALLRFRVTF
jgi:porin